jgi:iron complex outermembrane receptor protein
MKVTPLCFFTALLFSATLMAQEIMPDTLPVRTLEDVVVKGYEQNRKLKETAGPVSLISPQQLQRFGNASVLPALNSIPGVRMEERSPGSYRLNFRGSSLRSPFGVRNVKVYLDGVPFTDPGGNTYLNQLSFYNFTSLEILKGPAGSLYGAGMGGVMLINSMPEVSNSRFTVNYSKGSYNANNFNIAATTSNSSFYNTLSYSHQNSDGYRQQSAMQRDVALWSTRIKGSEKQTLSTHILWGDLFYETPGGLTKSQYLANPKAARPAGGGFPSALQNKASIYQKMFRAGIEHQYNFSDHWKNSTSVYGAFAQVRNPAIRNYERRLEPNYGGRTLFTYSTNLKAATKLSVVAGAEYQQGYSAIKVYKNNKGNPDSLQTDDEVSNHQSSFFAQADVGFATGWFATAGLSFNTSAVTFNRLSVVPAFLYHTNFHHEFTPRFSVLKKIKERASVYAVVSKGFSPPTVAELLPSTSVINTSLQAENGTNYELGFRGSFFKSRLFLDVNAFSFALQNAISQRRDQSGADYFINAGKTGQRGIETALNFLISRQPDHFITASTLWLSHAYHHFRYKEFKQLNTDFSSHQIPGVAPHTLAGGISVEAKAGLYLNVNDYYSGRVALNDANTEYARAYHLPGFTAGYRKAVGRRLKAGLFISGDNLLDETYSLGNDINAAGNRFYNAAPGANYLAGISLQYHCGPEK